MKASSMGRPPGGEEKVKKVENGLERLRRVLSPLRYESAASRRAKKGSEGFRKLAPHVGADPCVCPPRERQTPTSAACLRFRLLQHLVHQLRDVADVDFAVAVQVEVHRLGLGLNDTTLEDVLRPASSDVGIARTPGNC